MGRVACLGGAPLPASPQKSLGGGDKKNGCFAGTGFLVARGADGMVGRFDGPRRMLRRPPSPRPPPASGGRELYLARGDLQRERQSPQATSHGTGEVRA